MLMNEAIWIGRALSALPLSEASPCLNLGSSAGDFRKITQPWIQRHVIAPAEARGVRFIHADIKDAPGVDIAGDIFDPAFQARLAASEPNAILCCNMFEHVLDRQKLADVCMKLVRPGGHIIVSVPRSYPYHLDPIDTYFRPTPSAIAEFFSTCQIVTSEVVLEHTYWTEISALPVRQRLVELVKMAAHLFIPFYKWNRWKTRLHPLLWLFRRYRVSIVVLREIERTNR